MKKIMKTMGWKLFICVAMAAALSGCLGLGRRPGLVAVLTDYGQTDFYAGVLEGVMYQAFPDVRVSTITHNVEPFNVAEGAYLLAQAAPAYPPGTVFACIVDPGVGTSRRAVILETADRRLFVAPDNGLLSGVLMTFRAAAAYEIPTSSHRDHEMSSTFHGRDLLGPVAAKLAAGQAPARLGVPIAPDSLVRLNIPEAAVEGNRLTGMILHVDRYGNLISNISAEMAETAGLRAGLQVRIRINEQTVPARVAATYGDVAEGEWVVLKNAEGVVEIARNKASAAQTVQAKAGFSVVIGP